MPQLDATPMRVPSAASASSVASAPGIGTAPPAAIRRCSSSTQRASITARAAGSRSGNSEANPSLAGRPTIPIHSSADGGWRSRPSSPNARRTPVLAAWIQNRSVAASVPSRSNRTASNSWGGFMARAAGAAPSAEG
jgi:hypothetical protein